MARIRSIKLDLFMDDGLAEVSLEAHFLLAGLPCIADSAGRLEDRPRRIQAQIFPYRPTVDVDACLTELATAGHVRRYEVAGVRYLQVENWGQDQRPHVKEAPSSIPSLADSTEHRKGGELAGNSPGTRRDESAGIMGVGSGVLGVGSGDLPPPSSAAPRDELRLEAQEKPRKRTKPEKAPDPRHAPLRLALVDMGFTIDGPGDAAQVTALLALADQREGTSGAKASREVLRRARIAWEQWPSFNSARTLKDFRAHWGRFDRPDVKKPPGGTQAPMMSDFSSVLPEATNYDDTAGAGTGEPGQIPSAVPPSHGAGAWDDP